MSCTEVACVMHSPQQDLILSSSGIDILVMHLLSSLILQNYPDLQGSNLTSLLLFFLLCSPTFGLPGEWCLQESIE